LFIFRCDKKKPVRTDLTGSTGESAMWKHLKLLLRIVVEIDVKVKITVIRVVPHFGNTRN
jgi:hypothetical protein